MFTKKRKTASESIWKQMLFFYILFLKALAFKLIKSIFQQHQIAVFNAVFFTKSTPIQKQSVNSMFLRIVQLIASCKQQILASFRSQTHSKAQ